MEPGDPVVSALQDVPRTPQVLQLHSVVGDRAGPCKGIRLQQIFIFITKAKFGETDITNWGPYQLMISPLCLHFVSATEGRGVPWSFLYKQASWLPYVRTCARGQKREAGFDFSIQGLSNWENKFHVRVRQGHQQNKIM